MPDERGRDCQAKSGLTKLSYRTRQKAVQSMRKMQSRTTSTTYDLHVYRCPDCGYYHIGHG